MVALWLLVDIKGLELGGGVEDLETGRNYIYLYNEQSAQYTIEGKLRPRHLTLSVLGEQRMESARDER